MHPLQLAQRVAALALVALGLVALGTCSVASIKMAILIRLYPMKNARVNALIHHLVP